MLNNNDIIAGCVNKDRIAQKALYEKYGAKMFGFCLRYSNGRTDAQDLLQDGFIKVFDSIATLKDPSQLEGWMSRVFINLALSKFRKTSRGPLMVEAVDVSDESTEEVIVESEPLEIEIVLQCLMLLPENYRMVLNLYAIDKLSHKEIAESLGTTISNSKSLLHRARVLLKELVEQQRNKDTGKQ
ncbi:MAG: RNA polymerase sigma factor [Bacteroidota bacterium]